MGCPGGMSTIRVFTSAFRAFFFKFSENKIVLGKKIVVPCLATWFPGFSPNHPRVGRVGENAGNEVSMFDGLFPEKYTVKDHISTDRADAPSTSHNTR